LTERPAGRREKFFLDRDTYFIARVFSDAATTVAFFASYKTKQV
jgi:hypothetical protein